MRRRCGSIRPISRGVRQRAPAVPALHLWGDPERFKETYWSRFAEQGWYFAGDGARYDADGAIWVLGRIDDVMNVSGLLDPSVFEAIRASK